MFFFVRHLLHFHFIFFVCIRVCKLENNIELHSEAFKQLNSVRPFILTESHSG